MVYRIASPSHRFEILYPVEDCDCSLISLIFVILIIRIFSENLKRWRGIMLKAVVFEIRKSNDLFYRHYWFILPALFVYFAGIIWLILLALFVYFAGIIWFILPALFVYFAGIIILVCRNYWFILPALFTYFAGIIDFFCRHFLFTLPALLTYFAGIIDLFCRHYWSVWWLILPALLIYFAGIIDLFCRHYCMEALKLSSWVSSVESWDFKEKS